MSKPKLNEKKVYNRYSVNNPTTKNRYNGYLILSFLFLLLHIPNVFAGSINGKSDVTKDSVLYNKIIAIDAIKLSLPSEALNQALIVLEQSIDVGAKRVEAIANTTIAVILRHQGLYVQSIEYYQKAMDYLLLTSDSLNLGWYYTDVGNIYFEQQLYEKAKKYYQKSIDLHNRAGDPYQQATAYNNLGLIEIEQGNNSIALDYFYKALSFRELGDSPYLLVHSYMYIADLLLSMGNKEEAMKYYKLILDIGVINSDANKIGITHQQIGKIKLLTGDKEQAIQHFLKAEQNFILETQPKLLVQLYMYLAEIYDKDTDLAKYYMQKAYTVATEYKLISLQQKTLTKLIEYNVAYEENMEAIANYQLLTDIMQETYNSEFNKVLESMELQLKISQYKSDIAKKNSAIEKSLIIRNTIIALALALLVFLIYIYISYNNRKAAATIIHKQKEDLLLQKLEMEKLIKQETQQKLETKQRHLVIKVSMLQQKNDQLINIQTELKNQINLIKNPIERCHFDIVVSSVNSALNHKGYWKEFEKEFIEIFPGFIEELSRKFPNLTATDLKFCAYQKMNHSTKDIAILTGLSVRSVESRRYRLRQKLGLSTKTNLVSFLHSF